MTRSMAECQARMERDEFQHVFVAEHACYSGFDGAAVMNWLDAL